MNDLSTSQTIRRSAQAETLMELVRALPSPHSMDRRRQQLREIERIVNQMDMAPAPCRHRLVDARNPVVRSGYLCIDCHAVFQSADHTTKDWEKRFGQGRTSFTTPVK